MVIALVGISYRTAPVGVRERYALSGERARRFLRAVRQEGRFEEALVLDTCNRTEVLLAARDVAGARPYVVQKIAEVSGLEAPADAGAFYCLEGRAAVEHLFRVAAALDSQIVGEHQVLGQVRDAYRLALEERTARFLFHRLLHAALHVGKRVRTETELGRGSTSVAHAAVELAGMVFSSLAGKTVLFVGAGETPQRAARALLRCGAKALIVANRTLARAEQVAAELTAGGASCRDVLDAEEEELAQAPIRCPALRRLRPDLAAQGRPGPAFAPPPARAIALEEVPAVIGGVDLVISATASPEPVLTYERLAPALRQKRDPLVLIDIAVPRDVDERLGELPGVYLHNIDDLNVIVERNLQRRRREIPRAEAIVQDELEKFLRWLGGLQLGPVIRLLQEYVEGLQKEEIARYGKLLASGGGDQLERFTRALCQKILHKPLAFLHEVHRNGPDGEGLAVLDIVRRMFDLKEAEEETGRPPPLDS